MQPPDLAPPLGRFIIIADIRSKPSGPFEAAIAAMGTSYRMTSTVWLLRAATTVGAVRNNLTPHLGPRDMFFAAELGSGRTAWLNLGPEADARIRSVLQSDAKGL